METPRYGKLVSYTVSNADENRKLTSSSLRKATENLVGFSLSDPSLFKANKLEPIKDLKLLVKDYSPIAKSALNILINLSEDQEILKCLATDDAFLESLLLRITREKEPNANEIAMLMANLAKADEIVRVLKLERAIPKALSTSPFAIDQLMDCFVKGAEGRYNKDADYDYLSYFFADMAKHPDCRTYLTSPQPHDSQILPLTKLTPFTSHPSPIRRRGVASTFKNTSFTISAHPSLLSPTSCNILPYLLLPIMGPEEYSDEDTEGMLEDLQLLPPDKEREKEAEVLKTHLETLLLLTSTREGRERMREVRVYPIVRECHAAVEDEGVREACDRLVQVIMRDEEGEGEGSGEGEGQWTGGDGARGRVEEVQKEEDEEEQIVDVL